MKYLPIILILICLSFNFLISNRYIDKPLSPDERLYNSIAHSILDGKKHVSIGKASIDIGQEVTPFYSFFVAASYIFCEKNSRSPYILNIVFNCLIIIILFYSINLITHNSIISFLFAAWFIFYYPLWRMNYSIMMEVSTVFFLSLTMYLFLKYFITQRYWFLYLAVFVFSLLTLVNNRFIVLLFAFFGFILIHIILKKRSFIKSFLMPAIISLLIISPWFIRQYLVYDQFVFFTPLWNNVVSDKINILNRIDIKTNADYEGIKEPLYYEEYLDNLKSFNTIDVQNFRVSEFTKEKYLNLIRDHKKNNENIFWVRIKKYFTLYYNDFQFYYPKDYQLIPPATLPYKITQLLFILPVFLLSLSGLIFAILRKNQFILFLSLLFFSHLILHILIHYIDRYRLTILPVLLIIAAYGFSELFNSVNGSQWIIRLRERFLNRGTKPIVV